MGLRIKGLYFSGWSVFNKDFLEIIKKNSMGNMQWLLEMPIKYSMENIQILPEWK